MPVNSIQSGDLYTVRVFKTLTTNPALQWANTYEMQATTSMPDEAGAIANLEQAANAIVAFERKFHLNTIRFDRASVSTWTPDSTPYNPQSFLVVPQGSAAFGLRDLGAQGGADQSPVALALVVRRQVAYGRQGRAFYRGVLTEGDLSANAGLPVLSSPSAMQLMINDAVAAGLEVYMGGGTEPAMFRLSLIGKTASQVRPISSLQVLGATVIKKDHKYFDRA